MESPKKVIEIESDIEIAPSVHETDSDEDITVMSGEPSSKKKVKLDDQKNYKEVESKKKTSSTATSNKKDQGKDSKKSSGSKKQENGKLAKEAESEGESGEDEKKPKARVFTKAKDVPKVDRKGEKAKDKEQKKQLKLAFLMEPKDKEEKKTVASTKQKTEQDKQLAEIEKKYPEYVNRGKFKFPIEDKLFNMYSDLLAEHMPKIERPTPKTGLIPAQHLGDILQIWNFFQSFSELFKCEDIQKEEIYASLAYQGDEHLLLVNDMHQGLLSLYLQEFIKKNSFSSYKDETENPFFVLLKAQVGENDLNGDELALIWTEFASKLMNVAPYSDFFGETSKRFFEILGQKTCLEYNKMEYRMKVRILIGLIEALHDTDVFREVIHNRMDATGLLTKEKSELEQEIKAEEQDYLALKIKVSIAEREMKKDEQQKNQPVKESRKSTGMTEAARKEHQKNQIEFNKLETALNKKKKRLDEIDNELCLALQTASRIGVDAHKAEYWIFQADTSKIYVRHSQMVAGEEEWFYYDTKTELDQLLQSLNVKGIKEKQLLESLQELIKKGRISLKGGDSDNKNKENVVPNDGEMETEIRTKKGQDQEVDFNFWIAKVLEYDTSPAVQAGQPRNTRKKNQLVQAMQTSKAKFKTPKDLDMNLLKQLLVTMEENLSNYLTKWGSMWERPSVKESTMNKIFEAKEPKEIKNIIMTLNEYFQYSKAPLGPKKDGKKGGKSYFERDDEDEGESYEDKPGSGSKRSEENGSLYDENSRSKGADDADEEETKEGSVESPGSNNKRRLKTEMDEEYVKKSTKVSPGQGFDEELVKKPTKVTPAQAFDLEQEKIQFQRVKRYPLKFWGPFGIGVKNRRTWMNYAGSADNMASVYFATLVFCESINKYCEKMNARYFTHYKNGQEYMQARWRKSGNQQQQQQPEELNEDSMQSLTASVQDSEEMAIESLDKFKHKKTVVRGGQPVRDKASEGKSTVESNSRGTRLRDRKKVVSYVDPVPEARPTRTNERARKNQEKLDELVNLRRSSRLSRRKQDDAEEEDLEEEQYYDDDVEEDGEEDDGEAEIEDDVEEEEEVGCRTCGDFGGDMVTCQDCSDSYHLYCCGLRRRQVNKNDWTCADCLAKAISAKNTRSSSRSTRRVYV